MPTFRYSATGDDGKPLSGTVEAGDRTAALDALKDLNIDPESVEEAARQRQAPPQMTALGPVTSFAFEGIDSSGKTQKGTVQAATKFQAFTTIQRTHGIRLTALTPAGSAPITNDPDLTSWQSQPQKTGTPHRRSFVPLLTTLKLYAGWLLAWYGLFLALGHYSLERALPFSIPFVTGFASSGSITAMTVVLFVILLISSMFDSRSTDLAAS